MVGPNRMTSENRQAAELLITAVERLVEKAAERGWPLHLVVDAAFRAGVTLSLTHVGLAQTAAHCRNLANDLDRLSELLGYHGDAA
jgi:hypothetical protein